MADPQSVIHRSLQAIGLGPERIASAFEGSQLFGKDGLLTSMEFVQFIADICDDIELDIGAALENIDQYTSIIFNNVQSLSDFLSQRATASPEA